MKTMMIAAVAVTALLAAAPTLAKDNKALKQGGSKESTSVSQEDASRHLDKDGTFQGKPVVQGPADWRGAGSASSGSSSGDSGASETSPPAKK